MTPKVSFIIPAFNIEDYIGKCLDSILNQTWQDFEIIVVNDGSKDKTGEVLDTYAAKDSRIKILHKENEGVSAARNDGICRSLSGDSEARGSCCGWMLRYNSCIYKGSLR